MTGKSGSIFDIMNPWKLDPRVKDKLKGTFFNKVAELTGYTQRRDFLTFIKKCYDKKLRTFTFGPKRDIELYFGLEDVYYISGIPVDGVPVICNDIDAKELCTDYLGEYEVKKLTDKKLKVSKAWLREKFEVVPEDIPEPQLHKYVRGYLMYLIGSKILPNCDDSSSFPVYWLQFLTDLTPSKLNGVAWGAAAHVLLIKSLHKRKNVKGPTWMLEVFFLERISKLETVFMGVVPNLMGLVPKCSPSEEQKKFPLHFDWCPRMVAPGKITTKDITADLDSIRDNLAVTDIKLKPYATYESYRRQRIFFSRTILFNFNDISYHEPENVACQLGIDNLQPLREQEVLKGKSAGGHSQRKLLTAYADYLVKWNDRYLETMCIRDTNTTFELPPYPDEDSDISDPIITAENAIPNHVSTLPARQEVVTEPNPSGSMPSIESHGSMFNVDTEESSFSVSSDMKLSAFIKKHSAKKRRTTVGESSSRKSDDERDKERDEAFVSNDDFSDHRFRSTTTDNEHPENGQGSGGNKPENIRSEYFQKVHQALVTGLRKHEETVIQDGSGLAGMRQGDLIQWYVEEQNQNVKYSSIEQAHAEVTNIRAIIKAQPAEHGENLLGSKKRVCRPEDKDYHEEVVKSSHNRKKKHTVIIDDDSEEELLDLNTEKCGLVENVSPKSDCKDKKTFPFTTEISKLTKDAVVRRCQHKEKTITVDDPPLPSKFVAEGKGNRKRKNTPSNKQEFVLIDDDREEEFLDLKTEKWESVENVSPKTDCLEPPLPEKVLSPESGITCVRGYNVKNNIASILEAIFKKHGDIAAKSIFKIDSVRTSFLEVVCKVVMRIQTDNITTIISEMNEIDSQVSEAEAANIDVSWIRAYLADIEKRKAAMENSAVLTEMKANTSLVKTAAQMDLKESRERFEKAERCVKVLDLVEKKLSYNILESKAKKDTWVKQPIL